LSRHREAILLDNNAIGDAVDHGVWQALLGAYGGQLETVTEVAGEAGSYFRQLENPDNLMASLDQLQIHTVTQLDRAELAEKLGGVVLDDGERDLWAHARKREDYWILCGPDKASLRAAVKLGQRDRIVSLEELLRAAGISTRNLPIQHTKRWLDETVGQFVVEEVLK